MRIVSRAEWGAKPWNGTPATVPLSARSEFFVHWNGPVPPYSTGVAVPRYIERVHRNQGWAGVGYSFVVDQDGTVYEGRGWGFQGAHCPGHNVSGLGVQVAIGEGQKPTAAALAAVRDLYEEACRRTGRALAKKGHKDGFSTECPGPDLYAWVHDGMPVDGGAKPAEPARPKPSGPARYQVTINGLAYGYGARGSHVTAVGEALEKKGFGKHYRVGPGPEWSDADTLNYQDWQESLGYSGKDADGVPGEASLKKLLGTLPGKTAPKPAPPFPGRDKFGPGKRGAHITAMGRQLTRKGFGKHYRVGPGPEWSEADRKNLADYQRSRPELRGDADGLPGPLTWRLLFS
jgi:hypothetical protein